MGSLNATNLAFDGSSSTSPQYSEAVDMAVFSGSLAAWVIKVSMVAGPLAITLQMNADPSTSTYSGWQDVTSSSLTILDMTNSTALGQTDGSIEGGETRGGVLTGSSTNVHLYFPYTPVPAQYRLKFQITSSTVATVDSILTAP